MRRKHLLRLGLASLLLVAFGLLGGCASVSGTSSQVAAARQTAMQLCLAYGPSPEAKDPPSALSDLCKAYVGEIGSPARNGGDLSQVTLPTIDSIGRLCREALPDDTGSTEFCRVFAKKRYDETEQLISESKTSKSLPLTVLLETVKSCVLLADHLLGEAPETGYCITDAHRELLAVIQPGDLDEQSDSANPMSHRFPLGTSVESMLDSLRSAGFSCLSTENTCRGKNDVLAFKSRRLAGMAGIVWTIRWHGDAQGRLDAYHAHVVGAGL